ncbi:ABC transporter ATP-binding protein [Rhodanobacter spathiphylli]|uniref:ABC transporter-like protein n=2 Tax=Rhodanobacter TaxID=75309 RepID=I4VQY7_9GAMM|nr:ABC transporter ATP-binding protein [Rhodanobacter spathiphylli]EIL89628.1 ABC transporter-like protein [Rhodanobacter spathiphylli B39]
MTGGGNTMVRMEAVTRHYRIGGQLIAALDGVSFAVPQGQFMAIVGPSGSGKSTLLNMLGCLDRPDSGRYLLDDVDVSTFDDERASDFRNRRIGFVFQSFHLLPRLSVLENALLPRRFLRGSDEGLEQRAHELLQRMGLQRHLAHRPGQLSGGQMQRVAIARALLMKPALLLADEPTGNLDSKSAADVLALLAEVHGDGQTVVMVTHDADVAARAQRQISLRDGRIEHDSAA